MLLWLHVLPFAAVPLLAWAYAAESGSWPFAVLVLALPAVYGWLVPGIATSVYQLWRFTGRASAGGILYHHGLLWAANLAGLLLPIYACAGGASALLVPLATLSLTAGLWLHDFGLVTHGLVRIDNPPARAGSSPARIVAFYAPWCFPLVGAGYAGAVAIGHHLLVVAGQDDLWTCLGIGLGGLLAMWLPASLVYGWRHGWLIPPRPAAGAGD